MTETSTQQLSSAKFHRARIFLAGVSSAVLFLSGCAARAKVTIPWSTAVLVRPVTPKRASVQDNLSDVSPELDAELPPLAAPLPVARTGPPRPRTAAPSPTQTTPVKPETPQIVPELPPQQASSLQRETNQSLKDAESNLVQASGKSLNAAQADLASKIRSFISDAREAGKSGDWGRARELAKKAQVLSEELVASQ